MAVTPFSALVVDADFSAIGVQVPRDKGMNGAVFAFDFLDPLCWPAQTAPVALDEFINMVDGADPAVAQGATLWADGLRFSSPDGQQIDLPDAAKLTGNTDGFVVLIGLYIESSATGTKSRVCGYIDGSDDTGPWGIFEQNNVFSFVINGQVLGPKGISSWLATGFHEIALAWYNDGGVWYVAVYCDGALVIGPTVATHDTLQAPTGTTEPGLGDSPTDNLSRYWTGNIYRVIGNDLGQTSRTVEEIVARDWSVADGRFA